MAKRKRPSEEVAQPSTPASKRARTCHDESAATAPTTATSGKAVRRITKPLDKSTPWAVVLREVLDRPGDMLRAFDDLRDSSSMTRSQQELLDTAGFSTNVSKSDVWNASDRCGPGVFYAVNTAPKVVAARDRAVERIRDKLASGQYETVLCGTGRGDMRLQSTLNKLQWTCNSGGVLAFKYEAGSANAPHQDSDKGQGEPDAVAILMLSKQVPDGRLSGSDDDDPTVSSYRHVGGSFFVNQHFAPADRKGENVEDEREHRLLIGQDQELQVGDAVILGNGGVCHGVERILEGKRMTTSVRAVLEDAGADESPGRRTLQFA